jgi:hypothetical protein
MINTVDMEYDHLIVSPYLHKQDDLGIPAIECTINQRIFHKTFYDTGSGVNIMAKITYVYLFGKEPVGTNSTGVPTSIANKKLKRLKPQ